MASPVSALSTDTPQTVITIPPNHTAGLLVVLKVLRIVMGEAGQDLVLCAEVRGGTYRAAGLRARGIPLSRDLLVDVQLSGSVLAAAQVALDYDGKVWIPREVALDVRGGLHAGKYLFRARRTVEGVIEAERALPIAGARRS